MMNKPIAISALTEKLEITNQKIDGTQKALFLNARELSNLYREKKDITLEIAGINSDTEQIELSTILNEIAQMIQFEEPVKGGEFDNYPGINTNNKQGYSVASVDDDDEDDEDYKPKKAYPPIKKK